MNLAKLLTMVSRIDRSSIFGDYQRKLIYMLLLYCKTIHYKIKSEPKKVGRKSLFSEFIYHLRQYYGVFKTSSVNVRI